MNTYRIVRMAHGFLATEATLDGHEVARHFQTETIAQVWIVKRATVANMVDLAQWLNPSGEPSGSKLAMPSGLVAAQTRARSTTPRFHQPGQDDT